MQQKMGFILFKGSVKWNNSTYPTVVMSAEADKFEGLKEDQPSVELLPVDYSTCVPVKVVGDGNCLYR